LKVGIVSRTDIPKALEVTREIIDKLVKENVTVYLETDTALAIEYKDNNSDISELEGDLIITIGGDGTILRTAMDMKIPETPLLGVNMGRRGFLSEVRVSEIDSALEKVMTGNYNLEENMKISSKSVDADVTYPDALNEVLVASSLPSKMLLMRLNVDGNHITDIQADGTRVASPAGSTAYNMSAGGSVVAPSIQTMILTAICPYSYFNSLAVDPRSKITLELLKPKADALVIIDGRVYKAIKPLSIIEVFVSKHKTRFIRFQSFYQRLKRRITYLQSQ
jgi:NAD+ kinase